MPASQLAPVHDDERLLHASLVEPGPGGTSAATLPRLLASLKLKPALLDRVGRCPRVVVTCGGAIVGAALYERVNGEIRVPAMTIDSSKSGSLEQITCTLLHALEATCVAGGGSRLVVVPSSAPMATILLRCGFTLIDEGCAGSWLEKALP